MGEKLSIYEPITGSKVIRDLEEVASPLRDRKVVHVNSTRVGGGVAEILDKFIPLMRDLGIDASWEVVEGEADFYNCTKNMHNALQGNPVDIPKRLIEAYEETNVENSEKLRPTLEDADFVIIHDPQPAALLEQFPKRKGKWVWRCHIDASSPHKPVWEYLSRYVAQYDASIFSLADFAQKLPHRQYLIAPSIDPLSDKNTELGENEINNIYNEFDIDPNRPMILQVSRFDRFKDPVGVIEAYSIATKTVGGLQLVLAGGTATDDPEGEEVLAEVRQAAGDDPDVHILLLPPDAHRTINALQRAADIVLQKSTKEGFGLTVTEGLWKSKPVIGGNTGGIRLQLIDGQTGYLVDSPEDAARRMIQLLQNPEQMEEIGKNAKEHVRQNFLMTRHLGEVMSVLVDLESGIKHTVQIIDPSSK